MLHTGDWKIDPDPVIGKTTEEAGLKAFGDEGIDAIICDSTNVLTPGRSGSEADVARALKDMVADSTGQVIVTRICLKCGAAERYCRRRAGRDRHVCLAGRGMHRVFRVARECGYLQSFQSRLMRPMPVVAAR